jgi:hypothetical protein
MDDYEEEISTESDLLDGERYSDYEETPAQTMGSPPISQPAKPQFMHSASAAKKFQKPNFQGVRKYVAAVMEELQTEYPDSSDKELRALATRRWHDLTEDERIGTHHWVIAFNLSSFVISRILDWRKRLK